MPSKAIRRTWPPKQFSKSTPAVNGVNNVADLPRAWLHRRLRAWFARHARALPWRDSRDPYAIWISEVMLQQTQVAAVIPYFQRFLAAFPSVAALARADEQRVLRLWQGLGYYRRAQNLWRAAGVLWRDHGGRIPNNPEQLRALPGLGRYSANAILSQAFDRRLPIVEANSARVLCRLLGVRGDAKAAALRSLLWEAAAALLPRDNVGTFNQALMELGALVCTPRRPRCGECPLARGCAANRLGLQADIPARRHSRAPLQVREVAVVLRRRRQFLLVQRPDHGRWANLWEVPHTALKDGETRDDAALRMLRAIGLRAHLGRELLTIRHGVTYHRITMVCVEAAHCGGQFRAGSYVRARWVRFSQWLELPISSAQRRLAEYCKREANTIPVD